MPIWNYCSLQQLHISIYLAYSIFLNFLIRFQSTAKTGSSMAIVKAYCEGACYKKAYYKGACYKKTCHKKAYCKKSSIDSRVGIRGKANISGKVSIKVSSSKDKALSVVYNRGVSK